MLISRPFLVLLCQKDRMGEKKTTGFFMLSSSRKKVGFCLYTIFHPLYRILGEGIQDHAELPRSSIKTSRKGLKDSLFTPMVHTFRPIHIMVMN